MKIWNRKGIVCVLLLGWATFVLWNYFHRFPFVNLQEVLLNGAMLCLLLLFFTALGARILHYFRLSFPSFAEEVSFSFGIGSGVIIFLIIGLCTLHILYEIVLAGIILLLFVCIYQDARSVCLRGYDFLRSLSSRTFSPLDMALLFLMAVGGTATFLAAATPPFFYDALVYHLAVPQQYFLAHGFYYMPYHHFSNFPMNLSMLFMVGMSFSGGMLAKLLSWSFAPMTAVAVYGFAKSRWGIHIAITSAAILFLVPGLLILSTLTSVDLGVMFYSFLSFSALLSWFTSRQKSWIVLSGIFCGLAVGTKYTALLMTFGTLMIMLFSYEVIVPQKRHVWQTIRSTLLFGLIVLCVMSPWFFKNIAYTGNPIYPFFNSLLGTRVSHQYTHYDQKYATINPLSSLKNFLYDNDGFHPENAVTWILGGVKAPWYVTMNTVRGAGKIGAVFLACLPLIFLVKPLPGSIRSCIVFGACSFWLWVVFLPGTALRYVFQILPPLSLAIAFLLCSFARMKRYAIGLLVGVSVLLGYQSLLAFREFSILRPYTYLLGNQSQENFLVDHGVNYYPVITYLNKTIPPTSKILYVAELRGYYSEHLQLLATDAHQRDDEIILRKLIVESQSIDEVLQKLFDLNISHIVINFEEMQRFAQGELARESYFDLPTKKDEVLFQTFFLQHLQLVISKYQVCAYQIRYPESLLQEESVHEPTQ